MSRAGQNVLPFRTAEAQTDLHGPLDGPVARHLDRMHRIDARRRFLARAAAVMAVGVVVVLAMAIGFIRGAGL